MTRYTRLFLLGVAISMSSSAGLLAAHPAIEAPSSPKGVAAVGFTYAITSAVSNFLWSFRWNKHAGASDETNAQIQEAGGISASVENVILGLIIPVWVYCYLQRHPTTEPV